MAIRPSILAGPNEKDKAKIKTASDSEFGSGSWTGIHGKPALDPAYIEEQQKEIYRPNGLGNRGENGKKTETVAPEAGASTGTTTDTSTGTGSSDNNGSDSSDSSTKNQYAQADAANDFLMKLFGAYNNDINASRNQLADRAWQMIESYWKENPLETDWGKGILDYYGVLGDNSANAVNATTAGENAGNIDSYAAANAERQRVSRYGQGVQTIMGMSSERFQNMISALDSIGVNTNALFETQGKYGVDPARQYATDLYKTDASSTAAYNELMAQIEGNKTYTYDLSDDAVKAYLMDAYKSFNTVNGNSDEIDWSTTDETIWDDVIAALEKDGIYGQLSPTYLKNLIAQIMKGDGNTTAQSNDQGDVWWNVPTD